MNNPLLNALNGAQAQPEAAPSIFPVVKPAKPQTPAQRQRMLNQTMQGPTVSPLQRAMMPNVAPVRRDTTPPALRVLPEYDFHRIAYGAENEQEKRDIMRREALTRRSNPNSLESVMASVDKRLGTKQGDEVRELIKSFAWIRSGGINRGGLKAYVDEGIKRFETQGIDSLRTFVETGRRYREGDPTPREGDDPELARAQYLKQSALQAQADLREGTPADVRQGVIDTGSSPQFGDALATGVYNTNPLGMIGQGIRNIQEIQAGKAPTVAMASEYGQNLAVDKPHMGEDPGLIALGIFNDFLAPASRAYRQTMGPVSSANEGTQLGLQIGDFAAQIAVAAALPQSAAQGIAKLPEIGARFAAMDLPQYGEMVASSKGNAGKAATDFMEATFGQFAHAPKLLDPKVPWSEKGHIALGMLQGSLLLAGALAGQPNRTAKAPLIQRIAKFLKLSGKDDSVVIATQAKDAMETSMRFLGENADNPEVQAGIAQAINEPAPAIAKETPAVANEAVAEAVDTSFRPKGRNVDPEQSFQKTIRVGTGGAEINSKAHPGVTTKVDLTPEENAWIARTENLSPREIHEAWATPEGQAIAKKINDAEAAADHAPANVGDIVSGNNGTSDVSGPVVEMFNGKYVVEDSVSGKQKVLEADQITSLERKAPVKPSPFSAEDANPFQKAPKGQKAPKVSKMEPVSQAGKQPKPETETLQTGNGAKVTVESRRENITHVGESRDARVFQHEGQTLAVFREPRHEGAGAWYVVEKTTGGLVSQGQSEAGAIIKAQQHSGKQIADAVTKLRAGEPRPKPTPPAEKPLPKAQEPKAAVEPSPVPPVEAKVGAAKDLQPKAQKVETVSTPEQAPPPTPPAKAKQTETKNPEDKGYSASNVANYNAWKKRNPDAPEYTAKGTPAKEAWAQAQKEGLVGDKADEVIADIAKNKRGASAVEEAAIMGRMDDLAGQISTLQKQHTARMEAGDTKGAEALEPQINDIAEKQANAFWASRVGGTAWHNTGMARQLWLKTVDGKQQFTHRLSKAVKRKLTTAEIERLSKFGGEHERLTARVAELESEVVKLAAKTSMAQRVADRPRASRTVSPERAKQALKELGAFEPALGAAPMPSSKQLKAWSDLITYAYESIKEPTVDSVTATVQRLAQQNKISVIPDETLHKIIADQYKISTLDKNRLLTEAQASLEARALRRQESISAFAPDRGALKAARDAINEAGASLDVDTAIEKIALTTNVNEVEAAKALRKAIATSKGAKSRKIREIFGGDDELRSLLKSSPELRAKYAEMQKERIHLARNGEDANAFIASAKRKQDWENAKFVSKLWTVTKESAALLRTTLTTLDNSIPLRQGFAVLARDPAIWAKGFVNSWKSIRNASFEQVRDAVLNADPDATDFAIASGLDIPTYGGKVEENYASFIIQNTAFGAPFRPSERMASAAMMTMRLDLFRKIVKGLEAKSGESLSLAEGKEIAQHINTLTGRGNVGKHADALSVVYLAPRFAKSRIDLILGGVDLMRSREGMTPRVKKEVGKSLAAYYGAVTAAVFLAKLAGAKVEEDSRSADFLDAKFSLPGGGEMVIDLSGGGSNYVKSLSRLALSFGTMFKPELKTDKTPDGLKTRNLWEQGIRESVGKAAPLTGALAVGGGALKDRGGKSRNILGQETDIGRELTRTGVPIQVMSTIQNQREGAKPEAATLAFLMEFLGVGTQYRKGGDNRNQKAVYDVNPVEDIKKALKR